MGVREREQIRFLLKKDCDIEGFLLNVEWDLGEDWPIFVRENPEEARKIQTNLLNSTYARHKEWQKRVLSKKEGPEILAELYNVKNPRIIKSWEKTAKKLQGVCR